VDEAINDMTASKQEYKARIAQEIGDRLGSSKAFNDYAHTQVEAFRENPYQNWSGSEPMAAPARTPEAERAWAASNLVQSWAGSSGDNHVVPAALQQAVKDEFGLKDARTDHLLSGPSWEKSAGDLKWEMRQEYAKNGEAYRAFARAMYDNTQADLDAHGITEMTLYRGMSFDTGVGGVEPHPTRPDPKTGLIFDGHEHAVTTTEQPASSWSYSFHQASGFAPTESGTGAMLAATVPASRILSTMDSGWGCKDEKEVVVLGGKDEVNSWAWYGGDKEGFPPSEPGDLVHTKIVWLTLETKFSEDQARDEYGRWTTVGGNAMSAPDKSMGLEEIRAEQNRYEQALDNPNLNPNFYKGNIVRDMSNRLRGNAAWKDYVARTPEAAMRAGETKMHHAVNGMIGMWAGASGDSNLLSVTMQHAVNEEFGLKARTDHMPMDNPKFADYYAQNGAAYRAFAREMYNATQEELARDGIKEMTLYRGVKFRTPEQAQEAGFKTDSTAHEATIGQQPASSWSYSFRTAYKFSGGSAIPGAMVAARVPASRVLSTMKTGFGCKNEQEVVLLGSTDDKVAAQGWGYTPNGAPASPDILIHTKLWHLLAETKAYDENQPRDERGRWSSDGASAAYAAETGGTENPPPKPTDAASLEKYLNWYANRAVAQVPKTPGRTNGTGTLKDPIYVDGDLDHAAREIFAGNHVRLDQPRQVVTLVDKLGDMASDAVAKGEKAPTYDLGLVTIPGTNLFTQQSLGIPRVEMPQLSGVPRPGSPADQMPKTAAGKVNLGDHFRDTLEEQGFKVTDERVPAESLRATQMDLVGPQVAGMSEALEQGKLNIRPIFVSKDDYVVDGHHQWAATVLANLRAGKTQFDIPVQRVDADIGTILDTSREYTEAMGLPQKAGVLKTIEAVKRELAWRGQWVAGVPDPRTVEIRRQTADLGRLVRKFSEDQPRDESGRWTSGGGGGGGTPTGWPSYDSSLTGRPTEMRANYNEDDVKPTTPGAVFRGITSDEADSIARTGQILSTGRYSHSSEGTSFGEDFGMAESTINYGRDNPARTSKPTFVLEVARGDDIVVDKRDGFPKAKDPIPVERINRVWRFHPDGSSVVGGAELLGAAPKTITGYRSEPKTFEFSEHRLAQIRRFQLRVGGEDLLG